jgi:hypothetical protein
MKDIQHEGSINLNCLLKKKKVELNSSTFFLYIIESSNDSFLSLLYECVGGT